MVRGRVYTPEKPVTFNRLWDDEEQKRLEDLLTVFPDEEIAAHRWQKIARALGNRTPRQVASRVQKFFIRLAKEGKPIPGKPPNLEVHSLSVAILTIVKHYLKPKKKKQKSESPR